MAEERFSLAGKVALVTGGSKGIGRAIALAFAEAGADVIASARGREAVADTAAAIRQLGRRTLEITCDVSDEAQVQNLVEQSAREFGRIDILVNNAGFSPPLAPLEKTSLSNWKSVLDINLTGTFLCTQAVFPHMKAQKSGSIINMSSILGRVGLNWTGPYGVTKAGISHLTRSAATEWARLGIRVNAIAPGFVETDMIADVMGNEQIANNLKARTLQKRFGKAEEIVGSALLFASDAGSFITGQTLFVDGGWVCW